MTLLSGLIAAAAFTAFVFVERSAVNPVVPFALFADRNRLATFAAVFLAGGVMFTLTVLIGLYVQDIMGYSALRAGIGFIPFVIALGVGLGVSSQLVNFFAPRLLVIAGGVLVLAAMVYGSTLDAGIPYFPNLLLPITIGGLGIGMIVVPLTVSAIAGVGLRPDRPGVGDRADAAEPRRTRRTCRHPGRHHLAHALSGWHHRTGEEDDTPTSCTPWTRATPMGCSGSPGWR